MVDLQNQYLRIKEEIDDAIQAVLESSYYINGPIVKEFTEGLASFHGSQHAIPCANGTDALQVALMALDLNPGDEIITTPFTFIATAEVVELLGLKIRFVDIDPNTFNLNVDGISELINPRTKCIIPVHLFGQCCDMPAIMKIAEENDLSVIEDNAQSIGSMIRFKDGSSKMAGTVGHISTTSFFPSKNLGCFGDGGALLTDDLKLAERIRTICNHGSKTKYHHIDIGVNSRLDSIQAAVLNVKMRYLWDYINRRQEAANAYDVLLAGYDDLIVPVRSPLSSHVFHQYTLKISGKRDEIAQKMAAAGIPTAIYYPIPIHLQDAYKHLGYRLGDFPISEKISKEVLSLPMHTELNEKIQRHIVDQLITALKTT